VSIFFRDGHWVGRPADAISMTFRPPKDPALHSFLTSDVINEAEATFNLLADKNGRVSEADVVTIVRSIGMNPTDGDLARLVEALGIRDPERERQERRQRDLRAQRSPRTAPQADGTPSPTKRPVGTRGRGAAGRGAGKGTGTGDTDDAPWIPPERRPVVDWSTFLASLEPLYKNRSLEEEEIVAALRVFDREGRGRMPRDDLVTILTTRGDDVLAPSEVALLLELFPRGTVDFLEFAQKMQGTYEEPPPGDTTDSQSTGHTPVAMSPVTSRTEAHTVRTEVSHTRSDSSPTGSMASAAHSERTTRRDT